MPHKEAVPLLTPEMAKAALHLIDNAPATAIPIPAPDAYLEMPGALHAIAKGQTVTVSKADAERLADLNEFVAEFEGWCATGSTATAGTLRIWRNRLSAKE